MLLPVSLDYLKNATELRFCGFFLQLEKSLGSILLHKFVLVVEVNIVFGHLLYLLVIHDSLVIVILEIVDLLLIDLIV